MNCKDKGSFYTPPKIAEWMTKELMENFFKSNKSTIHVLEPSCGDGVFLKSFDGYNVLLDAVELDSGAVSCLGDLESVNVYNEDFLFWGAEKKYDLVIGNPPYIVKKKLTSKQAEMCRQIHINSGLADKAIANIWTSFVLKSFHSLTDTGVLSFVLPTELLQVNYSKEIRDFLLKHFSRVEVISFRNLAFESIEQDTVILTAYKSEYLEKGLFFAEVDSERELHSELNFEKHFHDGLKWSSYILSQADIDFVYSVAKMCPKVSDLCCSVAGIVTGANGFFIVDQSTVQQYKLQKFVRPIIQKGLYVQGGSKFSDYDFEMLVEDDVPAFLLDLNGVDEKEFSPELREYLSIGESMGLPKRNKCSKRNRWFDVPSIWSSEGMFFKRSHLVPKLIINNSSALVTDSAYRLTMNDGIDVEQLVSSSYNSLTMLFAELIGRYYGGGVLELTPNEFKALPLGYFSDVNDNYLLMSSFSVDDEVGYVLNYNDQILLSSALGLKEDDVSRIQRIYRKIKARRLRGK